MGRDVATDALNCAWYQLRGVESQLKVLGAAMRRGQMELERGPAEGKGRSLGEVASRVESLRTDVERALSWLDGFTEAYHAQAEEIQAFVENPLQTGNLGDWARGEEIRAAVVYEGRDNGVELANRTPCGDANVRSYSPL